MIELLFNQLKITMFTFFKSKWKKATSIFSKMRFAIGGKLKSLFAKKRDDSLYDELEELLFEADLGSEYALELTEKVKKLLLKNPDLLPEQIIDFLKNEISSLFTDIPDLTPTMNKPHVIMIVGVNGSGKTTSIAKLAKNYKDAGKTVLIAAGDTFRAAAIDQLDIWAKRLNIDIVKSKPNGDPASVAYDAICSAKAKGLDVVIIDTAGRLQTKTELMHELEKIKKVSSKLEAGAPHETYIALDATTGQNALDQIEIFHKFTPISGIILTKLDGSAKGGIVACIYKKFHIPVKWIGIGEQMDDLVPFNPQAFVDKLLSSD